MNLYALFAGDHYYPNGGADDLLGTFDAESDEAAAQRAVAMLPKVRGGYEGGSKDWAHLVEVVPPSVRRVPLPESWRE